MYSFVHTTTVVFIQNKDSNSKLSSPGFGHNSRAANSFTLRNFFIHTSKSLELYYHNATTCIVQDFRRVWIIQQSEKRQWTTTISYIFITTTFSTSIHYSEAVDETAKSLDKICSKRQISPELVFFFCLMKKVGLHPRVENRYI